MIRDLESGFVTEQWEVPVKCIFNWRIKNVYFEDIRRKLKSPQLNGSGKTKFSLFVEFPGSREDFLAVGIKCFRNKVCIKAKGKISLSDTQDFEGTETFVKKFGKNPPFEQNVSYFPLSRRNVYSLRISCEFFAFPEYNQSEKLYKSHSYLLRDLKNIQKFGGMLMDLQKENIFTDILIDCQDQDEVKTFFCHRAILEARSRNKFNHQLTEDAQRVNIESCEHSVVNGLLDYIYTGDPYLLLKNTTTYEEVMAILQLGHILQIGGLEHLFGIQKLSACTDNHTCQVSFEWFISSSKFRSLNSTKSIKSKNFLFCKNVRLSLRLSEIEAEENTGLLSEQEETLALYLDKLSGPSVDGIEICISILDSKAKLLYKIDQTDTSNFKSGKVDAHSPLFIIRKRDMMNKPVSSTQGSDKFDYYMVIKCEVIHKSFRENIIQRETTQYDGRRFWYDYIHSDIFFKDLEVLYNSKTYVDLILKVNNGIKEYQVHKIILSARSSKFKRLIEDSNDNVIKISVSTYILSIFNRIISYIYTDKIDLKKILLPIQLYEFAHENELMSLLGMTKKFLSGFGLSEHNAKDIMLLTLKYDDYVLKDEVEMFMSKRNKKWSAQKRDFFAINSIKKTNIETSDCSESTIPQQSTEGNAMSESRMEVEEKSGTTIKQTSIRSYFNVNE